MAFPARSRGVSRFGVGGFTLLELIVAMTIGVLLVALLVPALQGMNRERRLREPLERLEDLASAIRQRADREDRPLQIIFSEKGLFAMPATTEHRDLEELEAAMRKREEWIRAREQQEALNPPPPPPPSEPEAASYQKPEEGPKGFAEPPSAGEFAEFHPFPPELTCEVLFWGDKEWVKLERGQLRRWVFHPGGMSQPLRVRLSQTDAAFEASFSPLTAEVLTEKSHVP